MPTTTEHSTESLIASGCAIKVLDLLTNRYHVGIVRAAGRDSLIIDLPAAARFQAGQRIRFVLADDAGVIVARRAMRPAIITGAYADHFAQRISLEFCAEAVAA